MSLGGGEKCYKTLTREQADQCEKTITVNECEKCIVHYKMSQALD